MAGKRQAVTIKHVAADAGVSLQTVSRVINNSKNILPDMKARVQSSIDKLGYVPSIAAQRMGGSRSYLILALNDRDRTIADWQARQGTDWVDQMLLGGMLKCAEFGYRMIFELVDTHSDNVERELLAAVAALRPDGVVLTPPHSDNALILKVLKSQKIPFARLGAIDGPGICIDMNEAHSARLATEYLIENGHSKIAFIAGSPEYNLTEWRIDGWRTAMAKAGLPIDQLLAQGDFSYQSGESCTQILLEQQNAPTAIIASSDQMALAALSVARAKGMRVPDDLSLISFDNTPPVRYTDPQLTAIDQPIAQGISLAVEQIISVQDGRHDLPFAAPHARLIERGSVAKLQDK
jgi:LacI family transcriptional regulator